MPQKNGTNNIDEALITACKKGNRKAQESLYRLCSARILGVIYRYVPDYDSANEVLQLTCIKMFQNMTQFKDGAFMGWVTRIAINTALNEIKKNKKYREMSSISDLSAAQHPHLYEDDSSDIITILKTLNTEDRTLFNLRAIEGFSFKEIGLMMQITEGNARVSYHRVRGKVKLKVENLFLK